MCLFVNEFHALTIIQTKNKAESSFVTNTIVVNPRGERVLDSVLSNR